MRCLHSGLKPASASITASAGCCASLRRGGAARMLIRRCGCAVWLLDLGDGGRLPAPVPVLGHHDPRVPGDPALPPCPGHVPPEAHDGGAVADDDGVVFGPGEGDAVEDCAGAPGDLDQRLAAGWPPEPVRTR